MNQLAHINILIIGHREWYNEFMPTLRSNLSMQYSIEFIDDIDHATQRLWHNSYDILLMEEKFSREYTINLSKMSYAMSRPSIILCDNALTLYTYKLWKCISKFTNKFITSKKLIFFLYKNDKKIIPFITDLSNHHQYFDIISSEIYKNVLCQ